MALAAAGRDRSAHSMLEFLKGNSNPAIREVAAPVCEAVLAHRRGQHERVVALMKPVLHRVIELGGSHAQRDVLRQVLADSARKTELAVL